MSDYLPHNEDRASAEKTAPQSVAQPLKTETPSPPPSAAEAPPAAAEADGASPQAAELEPWMQRVRADRDRLEDERRAGVRGIARHTKRRQPQPPSAEDMQAADDAVGALLESGPAALVLAVKRQREIADRARQREAARVVVAKAESVTTIAELAARGTDASAEKIEWGEGHDLYGEPLDPQRPRFEPTPDPQQRDAPKDRPPPLSDEETKAAKKRATAERIKARRERAQTKQQQRDQRRRERQYAKWTLQGFTAEEMPPDLPAADYRTARAILDDVRGIFVPFVLANEAKRVSGYPFACLRELFGDNPDWTDLNTRALAALAVLLLLRSKRTRRTKDHFQSLVRGYGISLLMGVCHKPNRPKERVWKHRNSFARSGFRPLAAVANAAAARWTHHPKLVGPNGEPYERRHAARETSWKTPMQKLRDCGFLYSQQLPAHLVEPWERDTRKDRQHHVRNRYWLATLPIPQQRYRRRVRRASPIALAEVMQQGAGDAGALSWVTETNARINSGNAWISGMLSELEGRGIRAPLMAAD